MSGCASIAAHAIEARIAQNAEIRTGCHLFARREIQIG